MYSIVNRHRTKSAKYRFVTHFANERQCGFYSIDIIREVKLYNMQGQLILNKSNISTNNTEIVLPENIDKGVYILKVLGENNQIENFKILVE